MRNAFLVLILATLLGCDSRMKLAEVDSEQGNGYLRGDRVYNLAGNSPTQNPVTAERKLIRTGSIEFEVDDVVVAKKSIEGFLKDAGGYVSSDNQNNYGGSPRFETVLRIPSDKLDEFIIKIEAVAKNEDSKNIATEDVTEEFIDVETRLATKKELETRYHEILKQAKSVKDILEAETQLNNVRGEIESMEGRLKYLNNQVSYSTLTVTYYQTIRGNFGFSYRFLNSFGNGWDNLLDFIIGIFSAWPFVIMLVTSVWFIIRLRRRRNAGNSQQ